MPTRRQLLSGGAAGIGAAAVLTSCTPPPPTVAPKRYATLYRQLNGYRRDLVLWNANGSGAKNIAQNVFGRPAWFPDGAHLCVSRGTGGDSIGTWGLWLVNSVGSVLHSITNPAVGVADLDPSIGSDGQTIVFSRDTIGFGAGQGLWIVQADGKGLHPLPGGAGGISPCFSPDMKFIVYAAVDGIRRIPAAGGTPTVLRKAGLPWQFSQPTWSAADDRVAFVRRDTASSGSLCYMNANVPGASYVLTTSSVNIECPTFGTDNLTLNYALYSGYGAEGRFATDVYRQVIGGPPIKIFRPSGAPATDLSTLP